MVSQSRRPKLYDLTFQLNNNELIERNICLKLLDRSNKYKVLSWYLSFYNLTVKDMIKLDVVKLKIEHFLLW